MSTTIQARDVQRLQRLTRLQALKLADAKDAYQQTVDQCDEVAQRIGAVESRLMQAQRVMQSATQRSIAVLQLMSEACDAQLMCRAALAQEKVLADEQCDQARAVLLTERHRSDVLDDVLQTRCAMRARQQEWQLEQGINDLWLAARQWP